MLQISIDGLSRIAGRRPENWGELLELIEIGDGEARRVVTAVRFGGVALPTFREPGALARDLRDLESVDVQTASVDELLRQSAQAAYESIAALTSATTRISALLRAGQATVVARDLPRLTSSIQTLTTVTAALASADVGTEAQRADLDALVARFCRLVDAVVARRVDADWVGAADVLDGELKLTLEAWVLVARRIWSLV